MGNDLTRLFWLVCLLFGLGAGAGFTIPTLTRPKVDSQGAGRTLAMQLSLSLALLGSVVVWAAAGWHLLGYCPGLGQASLCHTQALIWTGPEVAGLGLPEFSLTLYADPLTDLFLLLVSFFTGCIVIYSFGWLRHHHQRHLVAAGFCLFVLAILLVLVVNNAFWLLLALELVSLASVLLMLYRGHQPGDDPPSYQGQTAIRTYLITSHLSLICVTVAVILIGISYNSLNLNQFRWQSFPASSIIIHLTFLLTLLGLGIRAGLVPFHFWVPIAHPQLPTNTHALMSGIMLKLSVYLMIRFFFEFIKPIPWWWGTLLMLLAGLTALVTVFYALLSPDLKRALAYHSVENMGIILVGLGLALLLSSQQFAEISTVRQVVGLALVATLYHVINHATFKTLLFLGTGSIENRTGTVVIESLGGILQRFRWTGTTFLIGAMAIAGFPPLNGFISEWLTLQALFAGRGLYLNPRLAPVLMIALSLTLILLASAFAMTALAFVKITGETLLGLPRNLAVVAREKQGDVPWSMRTVLALLAMLCLVFGLMPWLLIPWLATVSQSLGYDTSILQVRPSRVVIYLTNPTEVEYQTVLPILHLATLILFPLLTVLATMAWRIWKPTRVSPIWAGGKPYQPQTMQYTGAALASLVWEPLADLSAKFYTKVSAGPLPAIFQLSDTRFIVEGFNDLYNRFIKILRQNSTWLGNTLQNGDIRRYLFYIFATFIVILSLLLLVIIVEVNA